MVIDLRVTALTATGYLLRRASSRDQVLKDHLEDATRVNDLESPANLFLKRKPEWTMVVKAVRQGELQSMQSGVTKYLILNLGCGKFKDTLKLRCIRKWRCKSGITNDYQTSQQAVAFR